MTVTEEEHQKFLAESRDGLMYQLQRIEDSNSFCLTPQFILLLTLDRTLFDSFRRDLLALPQGSITDFQFYTMNSMNLSCREPPTEEAKLACTTEFVQILDSRASVTSLSLDLKLPAIDLICLKTFSGLESVSMGFKWHSVVVGDELINAMSTISTLRELKLYDAHLITTESVEAFCALLADSSIERLDLDGVSFAEGTGETVGIALASCNRLVSLSCNINDVELYTSFCSTLSTNYNTSLVRLNFNVRNNDYMISLPGARGGVANGANEDAMNNIRNLLALNGQRQTCPPLFAAIGAAETDTTRKQRLVEALEAVDIPVVFEYVTANQNNLIELIQRLGRNRKRQAPAQEWKAPSKRATK